MSEDFETEPVESHHDSEPDSDDELEGWPASKLSEAFGDAGLACFILVSLVEQWIHRRVEAIHLLTGENTLRRVSVDFTVPEPLREALSIPGDSQYLVPIAFLEKTPLRNFSLERDGRAIPHLNRSQNSALSRSMLKSSAQYALEAAEIEQQLDPAIDALLDRIVEEDPEAAAMSIAELDLLAQDSDQATAIVESSYCGLLINSLSAGYLMLAMVDEPFKRSIVKYEYERALINQSADHPEDSKWSARAVWRVRRAARQLTGDIPLFSLPVPSAAFAESYHCEIVIPDELRIAFAALYDFAEEEFPSLSANWNVDRASLYASELNEWSEAEVFVDLRAERAGFPTVAMLIAWLTTIVLGIGSVLAIDRAVSGPAVSLLLVTSSVYAGWLVRPGEHRLVHSVFRAPRVAMAITAAAGLAGATSLAFAADGCTRRSIWFAAFVCAAFGSVLLTVFQRRCAPSQKV